jgi:plastocyanin
MNRVVDKPPVAAGIFARGRLSSLGKISAGGLLANGLLSGGFALLLGFPAGAALGTTSVLLLVGAGLILTGVRWAPALGVLVSGGVLYYSLFVSPYPIYHFSHPKPEFVPFVAVCFAETLVVVILGASLGALVQNYRGGERATPRWMVYALNGLAGILVGAILIGALSQPVTSGTSETATTVNGVPAVHLNPGNFAQPSVTIPVGSKLTLVDDAGYPHILDYGSWSNNTAHAEQQPAGAPSLRDLRVTGTVEIGPFAAAGTYHIYCTIHPGMNLTVIVR